MPLDESKFDDDDNACSPRRPSTQKQEHKRSSKSKRTKIVNVQGEEKSGDGDDADLSPDGLTNAEEDLFSSYTTFCASDKFMSKYLKIIVEWSFKFASSRLGDGKERRQYSHEMREIFDSYVEEYERHLEFFLEREGSSPASFFRILKQKKSGFIGRQRETERERDEEREVKRRNRDGEQIRELYRIHI